MVRTLASHAGIRGSNPLGGAKANKRRAQCASFYLLLCTKGFERAE